MGLLEFIQKKILVIDGATGTMIQDLGLGAEYYGGEPFRMLTDIINFSAPEVMLNIHLSYLKSGASAVETNTFGSSYLRLKEYDFRELDTRVFPENPYQLTLQKLSHKEMSYYLSKRGAEIACLARDSYRAEARNDKEIFVLGSVGPSNHVLTFTRAGLAVSTFEQVRENFRIQVEGLIDGGVDAILFETQQDVLELKAGILGARDAMNSRGKKLPIIAQVTVDQFARMQLFNTDIHAALVSIESMGVDVFGINCSIGPDLMKPAVEKLSRYSQVPISVVPNAGLPQSEGGKTVYSFSPDKFAGILVELTREFGINIVGGCCGTRPEHIKALVDLLGDSKPKVRDVKRDIYISSVQRAIPLDASRSLIRIGERLNVRGSKKVREAVENETQVDMDVLESIAREQVDDLGCEFIDICMDSTVVDTVRTLCDVVHRLSGEVSGGICIDSFQPEALIEAVKNCPGVPILNSISLEEVEPGKTKTDVIVPATCSFGCFYIALCTDSSGPAETAEKKVELAKKILEKVTQYQVQPYRIFIDVNVFPIGSESSESQNYAIETLKGIERVRQELPECFTVLGVGNLTNGLAQKTYMRKVLTSVFLDEARKRGLHSAILNPQHYVFVENLNPEDYELAKRIIFDRDMDAFAILEERSLQLQQKEVIKKKNYEQMKLEESICERIIDGVKERKKGIVVLNGFSYEYQDRIVESVCKALEKHEPLTFVSEYLMPAMQELGDRFGRGEVSLPHLLRSADIMRHAMDFIEKYLRFLARSKNGSDEPRKRGTVVLGTVYQDVHSIGKDLTKTLLENYGYQVIDLGVMVPLQQFIDEAKRHNADAIGMSALLVQTANHMITVARMSYEQGLHIPILIGGAAVTPKHAGNVAMMGQEEVDKIRGDVFYCRTAMDGVNVMNMLTSSNLEERRNFIEKNREALKQRILQARSRSALEQEKLKKLPRRVLPLPFPKYPEFPRFRCKVFKCSLLDFLPHIHKDTLFSLNWKFGGRSSQERTGHSRIELEKLFREWIDVAERNGWILPQAVYGLFPVKADGDILVIYDPENYSNELGRIEFTVVIGSNEDDVVSGAMYFRCINDDEYDVAGLQITTAGRMVEQGIQLMKEQGDSEGSLLLQGLADRIAEDLAEYIHNHLRNLLNVSLNQGTRWSPGYPGMTNLHMNKVIAQCLGAIDGIGVSVLESGQFYPTCTTGAVISFHPEARYT